MDIGLGCIEICEIYDTACLDGEHGTIMLAIIEAPTLRSLVKD